MAALCSRNYSMMLAYIYIHTHTSSCRRESDDDRHTHIHIHTPMPTSRWSYVCTNTHTSRGVPLIALPGALPLHTHKHKLMSTGDLVDNDRHTYTYRYSCSRLIACTNTYFSTLTGAFPLPACGVTRNLHTYFTSVQQVFLVDSHIADCTVRHPGVVCPFSRL